MNFRSAKIVCTLGPASNSPEMIERLMRAGMDVARLNFSHGTHADHARTIKRLRDASARLSKPIGYSCRSPGTENPHGRPRRIIGPFSCVRDSALRFLPWTAPAQVRA